MRTSNVVHYFKYKTNEYNFFFLIFLQLFNNVTFNFESKIKSMYFCFYNIILYIIHINI